MAESRELYLNAIRRAANFGFVNALDEVTMLGGFAAGDGFAGSAGVVKVVKETLPRRVVVLQPLVEAGLLEDDAVVDAGDLAVTIVRAGQNLAVIGFRPAGERSQQIVTDRADVELIHHSTRGGGNECDELVVGQANLLASVEVVIIDGGFDISTASASRLINEIVA